MTLPDDSLPHLHSELFSRTDAARLRGAGGWTHAPRFLLLYGSLRERSYSRLLTFEAARLLQALGGEVRIFDPAGLLLVILRAPPARVAAMVACYIGAAYWFTASTSFANPAAAFGRMFSDSFAGIAPASVPGFVLAQCAGAAIGVAIHHLLGSSKDTHDAA